MKYNNYITGWTVFGTTDVNGQVIGDITPPGNGVITVSIIYEGKQQKLYENILVNTTINFSTIKVIMKLLNSNNVEIEGVGAKFQSGGWKQFGGGTTTDSTELLPGTYGFRLFWDNIQAKKNQNISVDPVESFKQLM